MFEKVNPSHPDKIADRIAGLIVDWAYTHINDPHVAVEVMIGHGVCNIITESNFAFKQSKIEKSIINTIFKERPMNFNWMQYPQSAALDDNGFAHCCGDNGIFKGTPITYEEKTLTNIVGELYAKHYPTDGKYIIDNMKGKVIACQSHAPVHLTSGVEAIFNKHNIVRQNITLNPLGYWTGGPDVDTGATNRKLGSDMGGAITGGGLHGKDLTKADVTLNVCAHLLAQKTGQTVMLCCAIGDDYVTYDGEEISYRELIKMASSYIFEHVGGFERLAEWGLIRPTVR